MRPRVGDLEVGANADMEVDGAVLQPRQPVVAEELAIGQQAGDLVGPEQGDDTLDDRDALAGVGVAPLVEELPQHGNGNAAVNDADHQDVHVAAAELPIGPIHGQPPGSLLAPHHRHQGLGQGAEIEADLLEEALQAAIVGSGLGTPRKMAGQMRQVHRPRHENPDHQHAKALQPALAQGQACP
jgi:hypothetical protein